MRKEVALLHEVNEGKLDNLECPKCHHETVSAWFTRPEPETFRTWLICAGCDFWSHVINSAMPPFFSEVAFVRICRKKMPQFSSRCDSSRPNHSRGVLSEIA